jgi:hypothetical protein
MGVKTKENRNRKRESREKKMKQQCGLYRSFRFVSRCFCFPVHASFVTNDENTEEHHHYTKQKTKNKPKENSNKKVVHDSQTQPRRDPLLWQKHSVDAVRPNFLLNFLCSSYSLRSRPPLTTIKKTVKIKKKKSLTSTKKGCVTKTAVNKGVDGHQREDVKC